MVPQSALVLVILLMERGKSNCVNAENMQISKIKFLNTFNVNFIWILPQEMLVTNSDTDMTLLILHKVNIIFYHNKFILQHFFNKLSCLQSIANILNLKCQNDILVCCEVVLLILRHNGVITASTEYFPNYSPELQTSHHQHQSLPALHIPLCNSTIYSSLQALLKAIKTTINLSL